MKSRRFNVHVEREVIAYAADVDEAGKKALAYFARMSSIAHTTRVTLVEELPETDERGPIIDVGPSRETRNG